MADALAPAAAVARRGLILILSSPSGAGKTTLTRTVVQRQQAQLSVSVTTRGRRPSEIDGVHYRFVSVEEFMGLRDRGELLEWAEVHGNFYGTPRRPVEAALAAGADMIFDIDWQGTRQVVEKMRPDVVTAFILPPSMRELKGRLERRAEDTATAIAAQARISFDPPAILRAERLRRERGTGLDGFVERLLGEAL